MTSRAYCFTKFFDVDEYVSPLPFDDDFTPEDFHRLLCDDWVLDLPAHFGHPEVSYCIAQVERSPETARLHVQGYCELRVAVRVAGLCTRVPSLLHCHVEARRGSREAARDYCRKEDSQVSGPVEHGVWSAGDKGRRSDLDELCAAVLEGKSDHELALAYPRQFLLFSGKSTHDLILTPI